MKLQLKNQFSKMLNFTNNAVEIAKDITLDKLSTNVPYQYSILYPLGQIGELAIYLTRDSDVERKYPDLEWSKWRGFRNRVFHDYGMLDFSIVLEMITEALPLLQKELHKILSDGNLC
jgi:uncharacterized protein with HEPN domain